MLIETCRFVQNYDQNIINDLTIGHGKINRLILQRFIDLRKLLSVRPQIQKHLPQKALSNTLNLLVFFIFDTTKNIK